MSAEPPPPRLAVIIEQVHAELASVASERDAVAAALRCVEGLAPALARLFTPRLAADGAIVGLDLAWEWTPRQGLHKPPQELRRGPLQLPPLAPDWSTQPRHGLVVIADAVQVPGCAEIVLRGAPGAVPRGVVLLPMFAGGEGRCQGLLALAWVETRALTDDEQAVLLLVRHALATALGQQAAERTARIALQESSQFYALGDALNAAPTLQAALEAAALPMVSRGATAAALSVVERADDGTIAAVGTVAAVDLEGPGNPPGDHLAALWIAGSAEPLLIDDVEVDPRVDPPTRARLRAAGHRAAAILPLASHGRTFGALCGFWPNVQAFSERDQRFLARLAAASATTFENRLLVQRMAAAMQDSARKAAIIEAVLEHLPVGVSVVDAPSGRPRLANKLAVTWLGAGDGSAPADAGRGRYLAPGGELPLASGEFTLERTLHDGQWHEGELDILGADGERRSYVTVSAPIADADGEVWGALTCVRDISTERRSELERRVALDALMAATLDATRAKSAFIAHMSHELRTPLTAIIGYSELLEEEFQDQESPHVQDVHRIQSAAKHLLALINNMLDLSKIEAGKMELHVEEFDLAEVLDEAVMAILPLLERGGNSYIRRVQPGMGPVCLDRMKVCQVLLNLLGNAAKFTTMGRIELDVTREVGAEGEVVVLRVHDTGIGMSPAQIKRIFEEFAQGNAATTRHYGGTGLGLAITRGFCQLMHGDIEVTSRLGEGSVFTVRLPAVLLIEDEEAKAALKGFEVGINVPPSDRPASAVRLDPRK